MAIKLSTRKDDFITKVMSRVRFKFIKNAMSFDKFIRKEPELIDRLIDHEIDNAVDYVVDVICSRIK